MSQPKKKTSPGRRDRRRYASGNALKAPTIAKCPNCGTATRPHTVCIPCGQYQGRQVLPARARENSTA